MSKSRREFLQSSAMLAMGVMSGNAGAQVPSGTSGGAQACQVPKMKFGGVEISRLVLGCNPFNGFSHFNSTYDSLMKEWFTAERVCEVMHHAESYGINAFQYSAKGRGAQDWERFLAEGGKMHLIAGDSGDTGPEAMVHAFKPLALHRQGEVVDVAYRNGTMDTVREWCKRTRDTGVLVGVATHKPEVIALIEDQGWDVDYFAGCVYNRTRSDEEWRKVLNGELMEMSREIYLQSDPPRMYQVMRQTSKPCFAFKILAAGRIPQNGVAQAFRTAFANIKPIDGVWVGVFPRDMDQVGKNAGIVREILTGA
jgi:thiamine monophosphate synthase